MDISSTPGADNNFAQIRVTFLDQMWSTWGPQQLSEMMADTQAAVNAELIAEVEAELGKKK